jgi:cytochrome oxidase Cu insertion factor (SCO1/SenC/PrrC family)
MHTAMRFGIIAALLATTLVTAWAGAPNRRAADRRREGDLKVGDLAPDFTVQDLEGKRTVKLSELKGKPVTLIFGSCT